MVWYIGWCVILLLIVFFLYSIPWIEGFTDPTPPPISPELKKEYDMLLSWYNPFLVHWKQAIDTAIQLEKPAPTEVSSAPVSPTQEERNTYVSLLSDKKGIALPLVTDSLPDTLDSKRITALPRILPEKAESVVVALKWMNENLSSSLEKVHSLKVEGFDGSICQDLGKCFLSHPEIIDQWEEALRLRAAKKEKMAQEGLLERIKGLNGSAEIPSLLKTNKELVEKANEVQKKAQSGELLSDMMNQISQTKTEEEGRPLPIKGDSLPDPSMASKSKTMYDLKQLFYQINRNLR